MSAESPYDEIAAYYDLEHRSFTDDVDLYLQFIEAAGDPVLELGCGTGRILRGIAEAGYSVTGLDSSAPMLDFARIAAEGLDDGITLIEGDFADPALLPDAILRGCNHRIWIPSCMQPHWKEQLAVLRRCLASARSTRTAHRRCAASQPRRD